MRWTRQRFARDGIAGRIERSVSDQQHADERCLPRTAKSCGPDAPTLASSSRSFVWPNRAETKPQSANDGGKRARSPGRARHKPLKPLRAGMPGVPVYSLLLVCVLPMQSARETAGAAGTRHSPRPPWGERSMYSSGATRREIAKSHLKLFWLFENRIGNLHAAVGWAKRKRAHHPCNTGDYARTAVNPGTAAKPALLA
jgi:hypothetical protein